MTAERTCDLWPSLLPRPIVYNEIVVRQVAVALYALALITVVVSADILFFRHHFTERLIANIGIVLVFAVVGFLIFGRGLGRRQD
jgi:hypothetical protein